MPNSEKIKKWAITAMDFEEEEYTLMESFIGTQREAYEKAEKLSVKFENEHDILLAKVTCSVEL